MAVPWILMSLVVLLLIGVAVAYFVTKKEKKPMTYKNYFNMGIIWLAFWLVFGIGYPMIMGREIDLTITSPLAIMGIAFTIAGLANKDKWDQKIPQSTENQKKLILIGTGLLVLGVIVTLLFTAGILS